MFMLKQNMATLMNRIATGAIPQADLQREIEAAIEQLRPHAATEPWVNTMMINFERQIRLINRVGVAYASRGITGIAANNAAVLATNRGVAMMSQDVDDLNAHTSADMFSTPAQRHVSGGIVRGVSGGYALHPPLRSGLSGDMASFDPFNGSYPPPMPGLPIRTAAGGAGAPLPPALVIPPPPTLAELEDPGSAPSTPRDQIRTVNPRNPPPAPRRTRSPSPTIHDSEPSPKRARVTFEDNDGMH